jgi:putative transposase
MLITSSTRFTRVPFDPETELEWVVIENYEWMERINKELKRRSLVDGASPNYHSFIRLGVSILIDINEEWLITKKYLSWDDE